MWIEKIKKYAQIIGLIKINPPADASEIRNLKEIFGAIPCDLSKLLKELNGDNCVILSADEIIETNMRLRALDYYMPLDCFLFFAFNGCGDYYGYKITKKGEISSDIFFWDHESDNRTWVVKGMDDFIAKYCGGEV